MSGYQPPPNTITTYDVGVLRGYQGDRTRVIASANTWLSRKGIEPVGHEPGRGLNLYDRATVEAAIANEPGKGSPGQPRPNRRKSRPQSEGSQ